MSAPDTAPESAGQYWPTQTTPPNSTHQSRDDGDGSLYWSRVVSTPIANESSSETIARIAALEGQVSLYVSENERVAQLESSIRDMSARGIGPAGPGNRCRKVWQIVDGYVYEAWANPSASGVALEIMLDDVTNAPGVWVLQGTGVPRPFNSNMAHLYTDYTTVFGDTDNSREYYELLPGASLAQKQAAPWSTDGEATKWLASKTVKFIDAPPSNSTNTSAPVSSGAGYAGRTLIATPGAWDTDYPVTREWYVNGQPTGVTSLMYEVPRSQHGASFKHREQSAGVIVDSNTITSFVPTPLQPVVWVEHLDPRIEYDTGSDVSKWPDLSGNAYDLNIKASATRALQTTDGLISYPGTDYEKIASKPIVGEVYFLGQYKDGTDDTFDDYSQVTYGGKRIMGNQGTSLLWSGSNFATDDVFKNGSSASTKSMLPLPLTLMRFVYGAPAYIDGYLCGGQSGRGWDGLVKALIAYPAAQSAANRRKTEAYICWSNGREDILVNDHEYKTIPPSA